MLSKSQAIDGIMAILTDSLHTSYVLQAESSRWRSRAAIRFFRPAIAPLGRPLAKHIRQLPPRKEHPVKPISRAATIILSTLRAATAEGRFASIREMGEAAGLSSSSTVHSHLQSLEALGVARRTPTHRWEAVDTDTHTATASKHIEAAMALVADIIDKDPALSDIYEELVRASQLVGGAK
jgi:hypothetical protein